MLQDVGYGVMGVGDILIWPLYKSAVPALKLSILYYPVLKLSILYYPVLKLSILY